MLDKDGNETTKVKEAVSIKTDYLSKEQEVEAGRDNLLVKFDSATMKEPAYKDVKIAFKVTEPNTSDRILINKAQVSNDSDKDGKDIMILIQLQTNGVTMKMTKTLKKLK